MSSAKCQCGGPKSGPDKQPPCPCKKCQAQIARGESPCGKAKPSSGSKCACGNSDSYPDNQDYWPDKGQGPGGEYWPDGRQDNYYPAGQDFYQDYYAESGAYADNWQDNNNYWQDRDQTGFDGGCGCPAAKATGCIGGAAAVGGGVGGAVGGAVGGGGGVRAGVGAGAGVGVGAGAGGGVGGGGVGAGGGVEIGGVAFGQADFGRKSSITEGTPSYDEAIMPPRSPCSLMYAQDNAGGNSLSVGRDTLGLPIHNKALLHISGHVNCRDHSKCNEYCGVNTDCSPMCKVGGGQISQGVRICSNDNINAIVTFLLEMMGILVFFAICTFTFWITVCYYIIQLVIDLVNAERNVHVAVGIVFTLLLVAYAITQVTDGAVSCSPRQKGGQPGGIKGSCPRCGSTTSQIVKKAVAPAPAPSHAHAHALASAPCKQKSKSKCSSASANKPMHTPVHAPVKAVAKLKMGHKPTPCRKSFNRKYTDCQGRKIFQRSRRNAILTEMKQPPTWVYWLREHVSRLLSQR